MIKDQTSHRFRVAALIASTIGAICSVILMLMSGQHPPVLLVILFVAWVLAPFVALIVANMLFKRRSGTVSNTIFGVSIFIAAVSVTIYGYVLVSPPPSQPAFPYVAVPLGSWVLIAVTFVGAALISRGRRV